MTTLTREQITHHIASTVDANPRAAAAQDLSAQALEALASEIEATVEAVDY